MNIFGSFFKKKPARVKQQLPDNVPQFIARSIGEQLKPYKFTRNGQTFYRTAGDLLHIINIQGDKWNSKEDGKFYLNLGVFHAKAYEIEWGESAPKLPKEYDAQLRMRLDGVASGLPSSWKFGPYTNVNELAKSMGEMLITHALPYLNEFQTISDINNALMDTKKNNIVTLHSFVTKACLLFVMGDKAGARANMEKYMRENNYIRGADPISMGVKRNCQRKAERMGFRLDIPELEGETCIAFYIPIKGAVPVHDERRTKSKVEIFLRNLEKKKLGYIYSYYSNRKPGTGRIGFATKDPDTVMKYIEERREKFLVPVNMVVEKDF